MFLGEFGFPNFFLWLLGNLEGDHLGKIFFMPVHSRGTVSWALLQLEMPGTQNATNLAGSRAAWFQNRKATLGQNDARPEQGGGFQAWLQLARLGGKRATSPAESWPAAAGSSTGPPPGPPPPKASPQHRA